MRRIKLQLLAALALTISAVIALSINVKASNLQVYGSFAPASIGVAKTGVAYFTVINDTELDDKLISTSTAIARKAELNNHLIEGGVMKMRKVGALAIPARSRVTLKPGGHHLMLFGLEEPLKEGSIFQLELNFEKAGKVTLQVPVKPNGHKAIDRTSSH